MLTGKEVCEYDVLVIGAGAAGGVIAARAAAENLTVGLVEAGPDWRPQELHRGLRRPWGSFAWTVGEIPDDYQWLSVTARRFAFQNERKYIRGRGLGGTSTINGMVMLRPPLTEFENWVALGARSWTPKAALTGFRQLEHDLDYPDSPLHSNSGPFPISRLSSDQWGSVDEWFLDAAQDVGHRWIGDVNGLGEDGIGTTPMAIIDGDRVTVNDAYIEPARKDPGLHIIGETLVDRVIIEGARAVGVLALRADQTITLRAEKVVLAAGPLMTPAILQRSGIGPSELLQHHAITVLADLPVGVGAQDHVGMAFSARASEARTAESGSRGNVIVRYSSGIDGFGDGDLIAMQTNVTACDNEIALMIKLAQTHSRGLVAIRTQDARLAPEVDLRLLSDPRDLELARRAYSDLYEIAGKPSFAKHLRALVGKDNSTLPSPRSRVEVDRWIQGHTTDTAHLSSTAPIGVPEDGRSVVDDQCRVHGIEGLWVGDLSVTPSVPRANTQLTAMMIGERVAGALTKRLTEVGAGRPG